MIPRSTLRALRSALARACGLRRSQVRVSVCDHSDPSVDDGRPLHSINVTVAGPSPDFIGVLVPDGDGHRAARFLARRAWRGGSVWGPGGPPPPVDVAALRWSHAP